MSAAIALPWDRQIAKILDADLMGGDLRRFVELGEFFAHGLGIAFVLVAVFTLAPLWRRRLVRIIMALVTSSLVVHLLKGSVARMRPGYFSSLADPTLSTWVNVSIWTESLNELQVNNLTVLQSFPSGHSASVTALAVCLFWLFGRGAGLFACMAILGCSQRIFCHAHWASDVLTGAGIGATVALCFCYSSLANRFFENWERRPEGVDVKQGIESRPSD